MLDKRDAHAKPIGGGSNLHQIHLQLGISYKALGDTALSLKHLRQEIIFPK